MLPSRWGQVDFSLEKWLSSIGLGKTTKSQWELDPKSNCLDTWCPGLGTWRSKWLNV